MDDCFKDRVAEPALSRINNEGSLATKSYSAKSKSKMADQSRDCVSGLPAEILKPLQKRKVMQLLREIDGNEEQKPKRKKKKHFKGTIYNYNKKKKLKKMLEGGGKSPESMCQPFVENVQTIKDEQDSNEEIQVVDEIDEKPLFVNTELSAQSESIQLRGRPCRCGVTSMGFLRKCIGKRCPCYISEIPCEHCSCCNCANPFNNNNGKPIVLKDIQGEKNLAVKVES